MNSIPAQEIKRRGIAAVDELLKNGPVRVIRNNRPRYVVMDEPHYATLMDQRTRLSGSKTMTSGIWSSIALGTAADRAKHRCRPSGRSAPHGAKGDHLPQASMLK